MSFFPYFISMMLFAHEVDAVVGPATRQTTRGRVVAVG